MLTQLGDPEVYADAKRFAELEAKHKSIQEDISHTHESYDEVLAKIIELED